MAGQGEAAVAYICGTFDTKAAELLYLAELLRAAGLPTCPPARWRRRIRRVSGPCSGATTAGRP